eukprot:4843077-Amphidinium_carterae.1
MTGRYVLTAMPIIAHFSKNLHKVTVSEASYSAITPQTRNLKRIPSWHPLTLVSRPKLETTSS